MRRTRRSKSAGTDPYADYLVYDSFTDTNGVLLANHTSEKGGPWTDATSTWTIQSNTCLATNTSESEKYAFITAAANIDMSYTMDVGAGGLSESGLCYRYASGTQFWVVYLHGGEDKVKLLKRVGGDWTNVGEAAQAVTAGTPILVRVTVDGDDLHTVYCNGVQKVQVTDNYSNTATTVALRVYFNGENTIVDSLTVAAL